MTRRVLALLLLSTAPAAADQTAHFFGGLVIVYAAYTLVAITVIGWGVLGAAVWTERVLLVGRALVRRPFASWLLGLLSATVLLLLLGASGGIRLAGLVFILCFFVYVSLLLLGLPAFMGRLGQGLVRLDGREVSPLRQVLVGGLVLAVAGGLPVLGFILLLMAFVTAAGAAMLSFVVDSRPGTRDLAGETALVSSPE
ncbi:MAG: hypothetical protein HY319_30950 [Armatimonadetes bacterium]|nr:hypothetical protein [Armatimonadota bacterium]